nr:PAS domain S-box protein [uncultured Mucilaginibacter sp.]
MTEHSSNITSEDSIKADVITVGDIPMIGTLLEVICNTTGMGFSAVARVTEDKWVACAVRDEINFGLKPGGELDLKSTICNEIRQTGELVVFNNTDEDEKYCLHHTPALYGLKSYISVPIYRKNGSFFGTLCAIDTKPANISNPTTLGMFKLFADLISGHLSAFDELTEANTGLKQQKALTKEQGDANVQLSSANNKLEEINRELADTQKDLQNYVTQLSSTNSKLQQAIEAGKMGTWSVDPVTLEVSLSNYITEIYGFPADDHVSIEKIIGIIHPEYKQAVADVLKSAIEKRQPSDIEYPFTNLLTGEQKWVRATGKLFYNSKGELSEYSGILMDITEQKEDDEKEAWLAAIIESSEDAIVSKTLDGIITSWNQAAEKMFGYTSAEAVGRHISLIIPEDRIQEEYVIINKVKSRERADHFETIRRRKSGEEIPISLTVSPIKDENGKVIGASKIARDISLQKEAEAKLQSYAERLEVLDSIGLTISADLDVKSILQKVTDATTQLTGAAFGAFFHNKTDENGESYMLFTLSGAPREAFEKLGMPRNTDVFQHTFGGVGIVRVDDITKDPRYGKNAPHYGMPEGHLPVVSYLAVPVVAKSGEVIGGLFFGHPEPGVFKKEHEQLIAGVAAQASVALDNAKLYEEIKVLNAKKDEFIGMASHELKTPLTSINGYLQILERSFSEENRSKAILKKALQQVGKLTVLISDLLDVSKIQTGKLPFSYTDFDIVEVLKDVTEMLQQNNTSHNIMLNGVGEPIILHADQQRLEQVVINLVTNAIKYSPKANEVIITVRRFNNNVQISVQDFGIGISKDQHERIFSRFYRVENLASHMSGLGIGLYITHEIVTRHKGKIWVESEIDKGSTFYFELPVNRD